jgi:hypothetical protein
MSEKILLVFYQEMKQKWSGEDKPVSKFAPEMK